MSDRDSPRVFIPPPAIIIGTLLVGLGLDGRLIAAPEWMLIPTMVGMSISLLGVSLIVAALGRFRRVGTRAEPWQPSTTLVRNGVFRFTRNPMYLGMLLVYAGIALALQSVAAGGLLIPLWIVIDRAVIKREENYLLRRFGPEFQSYRAEVRRWL